MSATAAQAVYAIVITVVVNTVLYFLNEHSAVTKWVKHRGTLAVTNKRNAVHPTKRPAGFFAWDLLDPSHVVAGNHAGARQILLYREFALAFFIITMVYQGVWGSQLPKTWITFFTNWTFVAFALYSILGIAVSVKADKHKGTPSLNWDFLEKAFVLVFVTTASNAIFLTAFYWMVIYDPKEDDLELDNLARHGVNVVILLGELVLSRIPIVSYHIQVPVAFTSVYAAFFWIYYAQSDIWIYEALDWSKTSSVFYYTLLPILIVLSFYLLYLVAHLREKFSRKSSPSLEEADTENGAEIALV